MATGDPTLPLPISTELGSSMSLVEARAISRLTQAFIRSDSYQITLLRPMETSDGQGGRIQSFEPLEPQTIRVIPSRSRSTNLGYNTKQGQILQSRDALAYGLPGLNIQANDQFDWLGKRYKVFYVNEDNTFGTTAQLELMGRSADQTL